MRSCHHLNACVRQSTGLKPGGARVDAVKSHGSPRRVSLQHSVNLAVLTALNPRLALNRKSARVIGSSCSSVPGSSQ